jgi:HAMP domain-containing protein
MLRRDSLFWKLTSSLVCVSILVTFLVLLAVYWATDRLLRHDVDQRALVIATDLSDAVGGSVAGNNILAVHAQLSKYALRGDVAYVFMERDGKIIADSFSQFPDKLKQVMGATGQDKKVRRQVIFQNRPVYETAAPILSGQLGSVHIGLWGDIVEEQIRRSLIPILIVVGVLHAIGMVMLVIASIRFLKPIARLIRCADSMTTGDLDTPIGIQSKDEIGELAMSLERMRASLKAAMRSNGGVKAGRQPEPVTRVEQPAT